jgi:hypothetical protein
MKKQILNLGKALNKAEQKTINGGSSDCFGMCDTGNEQLLSNVISELVCCTQNFDTDWRNNQCWQCIY